MGTPADIGGKYDDKNLKYFLLITYGNNSWFRNNRIKHLKATEYLLKVK